VEMQGNEIVVRGEHKEQNDSKWMENIIGKMGE
jgi:hypothetical protein